MIFSLMAFAFVILVHLLCVVSGPAYGGSKGTLQRVSFIFGMHFCMELVFFYFIHNFNTIVRPLENYQMGLINSKHAKCSCDTFCQGLHNICKIRTTNHNYIYIMWGAKETCRLGRNLVTGVFTADYIDSWSAE
jgi:hypothetical protein